MQDQSFETVFNHGNQDRIFMMHIKSKSHGENADLVLLCLLFLTPLWAM